MSDISFEGGAVDIMIAGFPGKSTCHGGMGWSTVALLRHGARIALVDAGNFGMRKSLIEHLATRGLRPKDVTDLLLTHCHYDHSVNWTLFSHARIVIGREEMDWAATLPWGETPAPELYVKALGEWPSCEMVADGAEVFPGMRAHIAPGHTPGCLVYHWETPERDFIFTGDAAKNRAELISRDTDMTYDAALSRDSIEMIWRLWRQRPGTVLAPGHDLPMVLEDGAPRYIAHRRAGIRAWLGDDMQTLTEFDLSSAGAKG